MNAGTADKIVAFWRQQLTLYLLSIFVTPDFEVNVELIGVDHDLPCRTASPDTNGRWHGKTVEYDGRDNRTLGGHFLRRGSWKKPDSVIKILLWGTLQMVAL